MKTHLSWLQAVPVAWVLLGPGGFRGSAFLPPLFSPPSKQSTDSPLVDWWERELGHTYKEASRGCSGSLGWAAVVVFRNCRVSLLSQLFLLPGSSALECFEGQSNHREGDDIGFFLWRHWTSLSISCIACCCLD